MFKVGDKVVGKESRLDCRVFLITEIENDFLVTLNGFFYSNFNLIRHATPEEIAAGHRIENDMGDDSHTENHISKNCKVIDDD